VDIGPTIKASGRALPAVNAPYFRCYLLDADRRSVVGYLVMRAQRPRGQYRAELFQRMAELLAKTPAPATAKPLMFPELAAEMLEQQQQRSMAMAVSKSESMMATAGYPPPVSYDSFEEDPSTSRRARMPLPGAWNATAEELALAAAYDAGGDTAQPVGEGAPSVCDVSDDSDEPAADSPAASPPSSREAQSGDGGYFDFNQRFQAFQQEMLGMRATEASDDKRLAMCFEIIQLYEDFVFCAKTYGRIIISEKGLPEGQKTIARAPLGGKAGGDKFIVHNILFKFAVDSEGLYDGDDSSAAKVAGHELKSLISIFNMEAPFALPLMALVDFRGYRLIAMSLLPIDKSTLLLGSCDAGATAMNRLPQEAATQLRELGK
jgi:hypothetical protein